MIWDEKNLNLRLVVHLGRKDKSILKNFEEVDGEFHVNAKEFEFMLVLAVFGEFIWKQLPNGI